MTARMCRRFKRRGADSAVVPVNAGYSSGGYSSGGLVSGYRSAGMGGGTGANPTAVHDRLATTISPLEKTLSKVSSPGARWAQIPYFSLYFLV